MEIFKYWILAGIGFIVSAAINREKTVASLTLGKGMMKNMMGDIIGILMFIGLIVTYIPFDRINQHMGSSTNQLFSVVFFALLGSITIIPAFVAFPLAGSFMDAGIGVMSTSAFLTTLTMVGFATLKLEIKAFGKKYALVRNGLSFIGAVVIAIAMGVLLG